MTARWNESRIRELVQRLEEFRRSCRVTTLAEEQETSRSPFRLLVACVISLRTKDEVTAEASRRLFEIAPTPNHLAELEEKQIAGAIYPAGFYNTKAAQLKQIGRIIRDDFDDEVPASEADLLSMPGVGRKTANLVLGLGFGIPAICVDTHVHRISNRLGLARDSHQLSSRGRRGAVPSGVSDPRGAESYLKVRRAPRGEKTPLGAVHRRPQQKAGEKCGSVSTRTPEQTERALMEVLPRDLWVPINDLLVTFGQNRCHPTSPRCTNCPLEDLCPRIGVTRSR
jgi:endonuclease-3